MIHIVTISTVLSLFILTTVRGQDTFSIIAADPNTGEIGAAGASCVDGIAGFGGIQLLNQIIPGRGGVNAQAYVCINPHINLVNGIDRLAAGSSPQEVLNWLYENDACQAGGFNPELRQYGVVDFDEAMNVRAAAFTGAETDAFAGQIVGPNYAIQGNILLDMEILEGMEAGFLNTSGTLAEKLMAAMQGANVPGADNRCLARGTSSTSAFLRVVRPDDATDAPYVELNVLEMPFGEEPIDSLQNLFGQWLSTSSQEVGFDSNIRITPNPTRHSVQINPLSNRSWRTYVLYSIDGKILRNASFEQPELNLSDLENGTYLLQLVDANGHQSSMMKIVKL